MATTNTRAGSSIGATGSNFAASTLKTTPDKYISLGDLLDPTKPDNRDLLVNTYGDQGITGFLEMTGATNNAGTADEVQWWEEGRLHKTISFTTVDSNSLNHSSYDGTECRVNDVLLLPNGERAIVTGIDTGSNEIDIVKMGPDAISNISVAGTAAIIGNIYDQGSDQPSSFYKPGLRRFTNPYIITKETYEVNGSQATNIGWVDVGGGDFRWYVKGEMDTRKRFMNQREMMLIYGQSAVDPLNAAGDVQSMSSFGTDASAGSGDITLGGGGKVTGSEGYFQALERRGITADVSGGARGTFASISDIDEIILELDKEGAPSEYAMYLNRKASLDIDDLLASGIATQVTAGLPGQFGAFNNQPDLAVQLGFKSFTRGGYTFHKHDWKLLNDPTLGGIGDVVGAMVPLANVTDAKTGAKAPSLQMNYKGTNGYNRDMEHWVRGSILGYNNLSDDVAKFYYRSECNLCVRAANQHVLLK
jgi:hypothetical protein